MPALANPKPNAVDQEDEDPTAGTFSKRIVPASSLPPLAQAPGPNSVFDQAYFLEPGKRPQIIAAPAPAAPAAVTPKAAPVKRLATPTADGKRRPSCPPSELLAALVEAGSASMPQMYEKLGWSKSVIQRRMLELVADGKARQTPGTAAPIFFEPIEQAQAPAPAPSPAPAPVAMPGLVRSEGFVERPAKPTKAEVEQLQADISCAMFNTGHLLIEAGGQTLRLDRGQARGLVAYLDKIASALEVAP